MKKLLFTLAVLPLLAGVALAAEPLSDAQMDRVVAGALAPIILPPGVCTGTGCVPNGATSSSSSGTCTGCTSPTPAAPVLVPASIPQIAAVLEQVLIAIETLR